MKNNKNLRTICLSLVAMALIVTLNVSNTLAYFTAHTSAKGSVTLNLKFAETMIVERASEAGCKKVEIDNKGTVDCYVRVRAFAVRDCKLRYADSKDWEMKGEYFEYKHILKSGASTGEISVLFNTPSEGVDYNVIVVHESTPVLHNEDGTVKPVEWNSENNTGFVGIED